MNARACGKCSGGGDDDGSGGVALPRAITTRSVIELCVCVPALRAPRIVTVRSILRTRTSSPSCRRSTFISFSFVLHPRVPILRVRARSSGELSDCSASKARQRNQRTQEPCDSRGCLQPRRCWSWLRG